MVEKQCYRLLVDAMGGSLPLKELQDLFGGAKRVALGCTPRCELVQVLTCYAQGEGTEASPAGPGERADCPCTGVRDSHYDNSCAEAHACTEVKIPERTINEPINAKPKAKIANSIVQLLRLSRFSTTIEECSKAAAKSQGMKEAFSTGSQNQNPPQPSS